jgi:inhibitor of KinA sporulation pathway (predicted exonuclease)
MPLYQGTRLVKIIMAKLLDKILVVDIEATCWNGPNPEGMENISLENTHHRDVDDANNIAKILRWISND